MAGSSETQPSTEMAGDNASAQQDALLLSLSFNNVAVATYWS